jgi:hypothetical protein
MKIFYTITQQDIDTAFRGDRVFQLFTNIGTAVFFILFLIEALILKGKTLAGPIYYLALALIFFYIGRRRYLKWKKLLENPGNYSMEISQDKIIYSSGRGSVAFAGKQLKLVKVRKTFIKLYINTKGFTILRLIIPMNTFKSEFDRNEFIGMLKMITPRLRVS